MSIPAHYVKILNTLDIADDDTATLSWWESDTFDIGEMVFKTKSPGDDTDWYSRKEVKLKRTGY